MLSEVREQFERDLKQVKFSEKIIQSDLTLGNTQATKDQIQKRYN